MKKLILLFLFGLLSGWAHGATINVSTSGTNSSSCGSSGSPCATPDYAVNNRAAAGDTVLVAAGTYTYSSYVRFTNSGTAGNYITLQCASRGACKIVDTEANNSGTEPLIWLSSSYIVIDGFEITDTNNTVPNVDIGIYMDNPTSHRTITHNIIHHIETSCSVNGGGGISASNHSGDGDIWDSNIVYDIGWNNPACNGVRQVSALNFEANTPARGIITNNIVYQSKGGWCMQDTATAIGTTGTTIANNLFFNCGDGGLIIATNGGGGTIDYNIVSNNTILNTGLQGGSTIASWGIFEYNDGSYGTHNVYLNNNLYGNAPADYEFEGGGSSVGGISVNPSLGTTFVNWQMNGTGDYHEKAGSPTIGAGTTTGAPNHDYDGNARSSSIDIGPYQVTAGPKVDALDNLTGSVSWSNCAVNTAGTKCTVTAGVGSVGLSGIPGGYSEIRIVGHYNTSIIQDSIDARFNGDTANDYYWNQIWANGSTIISQTSGGAVNHIYFGASPGLVGPSAFSGAFVVEIPDYDSTTLDKLIFARSGRMDSSAGASMVLQNNHSQWISTSAITSILMYPDAGGNFNVGSTFTVFGLK